MSSITPIQLSAPVDGEGYVPGACNIGPWEIRRRRAFAVLGVVVAAVLLAVLVATGAPAWARAVVFLPLMGGAFSYLQARRRFCAAYAFQGIANFSDALDGVRRVQDDAARRADLAAVARMTRDAVLIALPITVAAVLLPV